MKKRIAFLLLLVCALPAFSADAPLSQQDFNDAMGDFNRQRMTPEALNAARLDYIAKTPNITEAQRRSILIWNCNSVAGASDEIFDAAWKNLLAIRPEDKRQIIHFQYALIDVIRKVAAKKADRAEKLFREQEKDLNNPGAVLSVYSALADGVLNQTGDIGHFDRLFAEMSKVPPLPDANEWQKKGLKEQQKRVAAEMLVKLIAFDSEKAIPRIAAADGLLSIGQKASLQGEFAFLAIREKNRGDFEKAYAALLALPGSTEKTKNICRISEQINRLGGELADTLFQRWYANAQDLTDADRMEALICIAVNKIQGRRTDRFYPEFKKAFENLLAFSQEKKRTVPEHILNRGFNTAFDSGDIEFAEKLLAASKGSIHAKIQLALFRKDLAALNALLDNEEAKNKNADKTYYQALRYFAAGGTPEKFSADGMKAEKKFLLLRKLQGVMFAAKRYDVCRAIHAYINNEMFFPVKEKFYDVQYVAEAPKTAGAWSVSPWYNDWSKMETRFEPYGSVYGKTNDIDIKHHLKDSASHATLDKDYPTGLHFLADREGLHIYARCDDPRMDDILLGKHDAGGLEFTMKPGHDSAYRMWFFNGLPKLSDTSELNWTGADRNYTPTEDYLVRDVAITKDGVVAHTLLPWTAFYNELPLDGRLWYIGLIRWSKTSASLSGHVHEQERMLRLRFQFKPEELNAMKRDISRMIFNGYNRIRQDKGGVIQNWADPLLGDPEFYRSELKAFIDELDDAGKKLSGNPDPAALDEIFRKYVPLWGGIRFIISEKRAQYLKRTLCGF